MKKLRLELDDLAVESFASGETVAPRGTVRGHHSYAAAPCATADNGPQCWEFSVYVACPDEAA